MILCLKRGGNQTTAAGANQRIDLPEDTINGVGELHTIKQLFDVPKSKAVADVQQKVNGNEHN